MGSPLARVTPISNKDFVNNIRSFVTANFSLLFLCPSAIRNPGWIIFVLTLSFFFFFNVARPKKKKNVVPAYSEQRRAISQPTEDRRCQPPIMV